MKILFVFLSVLILASSQQTCQHAGGPVRQSTIINYFKSLVQPLIPYELPPVKISVGTTTISASDVAIQTLNLDSANMQLIAANTVYFTLNDLTASVSLSWSVTANGETNTGTATLKVLPSSGTITALIEPDQFKNVNATTNIADLVLSASNFPAIQPYWDLLHPILIDTLQREIPNLILEFDTAEIKSLVYPIVLSVEPVRIPDLNTTIFGIYGGFSNMVLSGIDFESATMGRGLTDNEVVFELTQLSAKIKNDWEFKGFGLDENGSGHITLKQTTVAITTAIGKDGNGEFTINLDNAKISIGDLTIEVDGGDAKVVNWLIQQLKPLLIVAIETAFQTAVCILFNGIPN